MVVELRFIIVGGEEKGNFEVKFALGMRHDYGDRVRLPIPLLDTYLIYQPDMIHDLLVNQSDQLVKPCALKHVLLSKAPPKSSTKLPSGRNLR